MLGAIISAGDDAQALARTLAGLVPAVAEGVLLNAFVLDRARSREIHRVIEAAGCGHLEGEALVVMEKAAAMIRAPWALLLVAGKVPEPGWFSEAAEFVAMANTGGRKSHAVFADEKNTMWSRFWLARRLPAPGLIIETAELRKIASGAKSFPPRPPRGSWKIVLRSKLY